MYRFINMRLTYADILLYLFKTALHLEKRVLQFKEINYFG